VRHRLLTGHLNASSVKLDCTMGYLHTVQIWRHPTPVLMGAPSASAWPACDIRPAVPKFDRPICCKCNGSRHAHCARPAQLRALPRLCHWVRATGRDPIKPCCFVASLLFVRIGPLPPQLFHAIPVIRTPQFRNRSSPASGAPSPSATKATRSSCSVL
jgi:hypothetical protein